MTPRGTDWTLAALVVLLAATGALTLFGGPLVFALHDVAGLALGGVLVWKLRRVWRRAFAHRLGAGRGAARGGHAPHRRAVGERRPPDGVRLQPAEPPRVLGTPRPPSCSRTVRARQAPAPARPGHAAPAVDLRRRRARRAARLAGPARARAGEREAALHGLIRGRIVRGQRVPDDLLGGGPAAAAGGLPARPSATASSRPPNSTPATP